MTAEELAEIKGRADAATPGPWESGIDPIIEPGYHTTVFVFRETENPYRAIHQRIGLIAELDFEQQADAEFIAATRTDVPLLVAEVRRLRAALAGLRIPAGYGGAADAGLPAWVLSAEAHNAIINEALQESSPDAP